jgi:Acetyltransferases, including N-acetylases of ribosomal proteins
MVFAEMRDIQTKRLILRKFEINDAPEVYRNYANNDHVTRFLTWPTHSSVEVSYSYVNHVVESYQNSRRYEWAIISKKIGEVIGAIGIVRMRQKEDDVEIGYCIGEAFWHQGITSEALAAVIEFIKNDMKPRRIFAGHDVNNPHSGDVMKKCGMQFFKRMNDGHNNQGACSVDVYEMIL